MNIEEIIEEAVRRVLREELESFKTSINTTLQDKIIRKDNDSIYGDIDWLMKFKGVSRHAVYSWTHAKKIPHYKKGKKLLFKKDEIYKWMNSGKMQTVEEIEKEAFQELTDLKKN